MLLHLAGLPECSLFGPKTVLVGPADTAVIRNAAGRRACGDGRMGHDAEACATRLRALARSSGRPSGVKRVRHCAHHPHAMEATNVV